MRRTSFRRRSADPPRSRNGSPAGPRRRGTARTRGAGERGPAAPPPCCKRTRRRRSPRTRAAPNPHRSAAPCATRSRSPPTGRTDPSRSERRGRARRGRRRRAAPCRVRARDSTTSGTRDSRGPPCAGPRVADEFPRDVGIVPAFHVRGLVALELLVGGEERLDLAEPVLCEVAKASDLVESRIADGDGEYFLVIAVLVAHEQRADRPRRDDATRERRLLDHDESVERVAAATHGVHDEAAVGAVMHRRGADAVETDAARLLVHLVLRARASRDLDENVNALIPAPAPHALAPPRSWPAPRPP